MFLFTVTYLVFYSHFAFCIAMKRAPPNLAAMSEPPRSKKIRIGDALNTEAADGVEDDLADEKTSSPYENAGQGSKGSGQDGQWTRVERRKQKKAKKLGHKADVCVFLLDFLLFCIFSRVWISLWRSGTMKQEGAVCDVI